MYVVGATRAGMLKDIRKIVPEHFLLIPGVGAQGGSLAEVAKYGMTNKCGLLVNSSRGIIFADNSENFDKIAGQKAEEIQAEMDMYLKERNLVGSSNVNFLQHPCIIPPLFVPFFFRCLFINTCCHERRIPPLFMEIFSL